jgi:hypothetical protein
MTTPAIDTLVDYDLAPLPMHEEEDVPEGSLHHRWANYLYNVVRALFPDRFAAGNVCIFWDRYDPQQFVAPDLFLAEGSVPEPAPRSYRAWRLPPVIFAAEIGSPATAERGAKLDRYEQQLRPREVLYTEPIDEQRKQVLTPERIHLYRWTGSEYEEVPHGTDGRVWSTVLHSWIGVDESDSLRAYDADGTPILNYEELDQARTAAEARAQEEAQQRAAAEERAREEARQRATAEERAREEARQRAAAEERAREEARQRGAAEARVQEEAQQRAAAEEHAREEARRRAEAEERAQEEAKARTAAEERAREAERRLAELLSQLERGGSDP